MSSFRKLLVPVDFSEGSRDAARYALDMAEATGASVTLFHVYGLPLTAYPEGVLLPADVMTRLGADARDALASLAAELQRPTVELHTILELGTPDQAIVERARSGGFDLIVMGTHGRTGLRHLLIGSVAERVVRQAECPVLTVRTPGTAT